MENAVYDAAFMQNLANRFYSQSKTVVVKYTIIGATLFSAIFYFAASLGHNAVDIFAVAPTKSLGVGLLIGVVLGFVLGQRKSYQLTLQAQIALCQLQIEKNTRTAHKSQ
jgi:hypothetical protein